MPDFYYYYLFGHLKSSFKSDFFSCPEEEEPEEQDVKKELLHLPSNLLPFRSHFLPVLSKCCFLPNQPVIQYPSFSLSLSDFRCRTPDAAFSLSIASHHLLNAFSSAEMIPYRNKYVLELVSSSTDTSWNLQIRVDVGDWFQYELMRTSTSQSVAQNYISELRHQLNKEPTKILSVREINVDHFKSQQYVCPESVCGLNLNEYLRIPNFEAPKNPSFAIQARSELVRSLVILPIPGVVAHYSNDTMAELVCFWEEIFRLITILETECSFFPLGSSISLNFGSYESANHPNCHSHAHVSLSLEAIRVLERKYNTLVSADFHAQYRFWEQDIRTLQGCIRNNE